MVIITIQFLLTVSLFYFVLKNNYHEEKEKNNLWEARYGWVIAQIFVTFFFAAVLNFGIGTVICLQSVILSETTQEFVVERDIASIEKNKDITDSFFLGCGSIGTETYFVAYARFVNGWQLTKFETDETYIEENDDVKPRYEYYAYFRHNKIYEWYFKSLDKSSREGFYKLIVPTNTIQRKFEL